MTKMAYFVVGAVAVVLSVSGVQAQSGRMQGQDMPPRPPMMDRSRSEFGESGMRRSVSVAEMKKELSLNAEQEKLWGQVETALEPSDDMIFEKGKLNENFIERLKKENDFEEKRVMEDRKVIEAVTPFYSSLNDDQKSKFRMVFREMKRERFIRERSRPDWGGRENRGIVR